MTINSGLTQHPFSAWQLCRSKVWLDSTCSSALGLMKPNKGGGCSSSYLGRLYFQGHSGCWQNSVSRACRTGSLAYWLPAEGHSQLWEAAGISWLMTPSIFKASNSGSSLSLICISLKSLCLLFLCPIPHTHTHNYPQAILLVLSSTLLGSLLHLLFMI